MLAYDKFVLTNNCCMVATLCDTLRHDLTVCNSIWHRRQCNRNRKFQFPKVLLQRAACDTMWYYPHVLAFNIQDLFGQVSLSIVAIVLYKRQAMRPTVHPLLGPATMLILQNFCWSGGWDNAGCIDADAIVQTMPTHCPLDNALTVSVLQLDHRQCRLKLRWSYC